MSIPVVLEPAVVLTIRERVRGAVAVSTAWLLLLAAGSRPARLARLVRLARYGARPATPDQVQRSRAVVTTVSLRCAGPHGCLLRSLSIVLAERLAGRSVCWKVGMTCPPPVLHAWVDAEGTAVGEPVDPDLLYTPILTV